jgi:hypothetical protein
MPAISAAGRRLVTGAAVSPDGSTVIVLTYRDLWRFSLVPGGALVASGGLVPCDLAGLLPQAEGVTWFAPDGTVLISSEEGRGRPAQLVSVRCPWPN